jgi:hypothetical protein
LNDRELEHLSGYCMPMQVIGNHQNEVQTGHNFDPLNRFSGEINDFY